MKVKLETDKHDGRYYLHLGDNLFIHSENDWAQMFGKYNWYTFHFAHIYLENDVMTGGLEFEFIILGLGLRMRWNYKPEILEDMVEKAKRSSTNPLSENGL